MMYNLDTKQEVNWDSFMNVLENNEFQVISKKWTEEEWKQLSEDIEEYRTLYSQKQIKEPVFA